MYFTTLSIGGEPVQDKSIRYIAGDEVTPKEIAKLLGIAKPDPPWVNFNGEDALNGMLQACLPQELATNFVEMGSAIAS